MAKIHLLMKKEEIEASKLKGNKVAVVFDVLLATSTIVAALHFGAKEVIPVLDELHARKEAEGKSKGDYALVGEYQGNTIDGFLDPNPLLLKNYLKDKSMILSTTNGTVAIQKCSDANKVYICSIINGKAIAERIYKQHQDETILIVCSGSSGEFCLEDLVGAGYFLDNLLAYSHEPWDLSDAALAALLVYKNVRNQLSETLLSSRVGKMMQNYEYDDVLQFVSNPGIVQIVASLTKEGTIVAEEKALYDAQYEKKEV
ncbi:2-phosphosulfolactate phosphatase [Bacillus massiliigorillae]|uniref:2-phosphosulfolactate phosphatase n=1 Tax=Bacillus massiliigorillae TaxID=1243664 RepID=UPI00039CFC76|nr:2-phosphosulfolactate phosphatase [Bacillus massiliigorillae]